MTVCVTQRGKSFTFDQISSWPISGFTISPNNESAMQLQLKIQIQVWHYYVIFHSRNIHKLYHLPVYYKMAGIFSNSHERSKLLFYVLF